MSITIKPHNIFNSGTIKVNKRIGNKIIDSSMIRYKNFNMNGAIHSVDIEDKIFTNFVKSYEKKIYKEVKEVFDDIVLNNTKLDDRLTLVDNENQNINNRDRLNEIIKESLNIEHVPALMKFKPKSKKDDQTLDSVRIYVYYDKNTEEFNLYLIDLFHLGIDGFNYKIGRYDLESRYRINSVNKKCISKLADDYIK